MRAPSGISPISLYVLAAVKFTAGSLVESPLSPKQMELQMKNHGHTYTDKEK